MLDSLGRYTHLVVFSNERIAGIAGNDVLLRVRADATRGKKRTLRIQGPAHMRRFLGHVLAVGFNGIRRYGLHSPARNKKALASARPALGVPLPQPAAIERVTAFLRRVSWIERLRCPHCARWQLRLVAPIAP